MTSAPEHLEVSLRKFTPKDINFILNSWKLRYQDSRPEWSRRFYWDEMHRRIVRILKRRPTIWIACDPVDLNHIFGWLVAEPPVLHFIYVKRPYREQGIALQLLASAGLTDSRLPCSHWTEHADWISERSERYTLLNMEV